MARKRKKNKLAMPVGIITILLAIVGLIAVISGITQFVRNEKTKKAAKANYEVMLKPVVMFDPDPFDDLTQADKSQLLYCAVWNILLDEEGMSKYSYSQGETIGILVPQTDIEKSFIRLFGTEIDIASLHSTIDMSRYDITYDAAQQAYILPITGVESAYTPKVFSIEKQGNSVILNVGYIGNKAWADIGEDGYEVPEPDKYMKITLREKDGEMYVSALQAADSQEIASQFISTERYDIPEDEQAPAETQPEEITEITETTVENPVSEDESASSAEASDISESETAPEESETV